MRFTHKIPKIYSNHADGDNWIIKRKDGMYKSAVMVMVIAASVILAGCSSAEQVKTGNSKFQAADEAAKFCSDDIENRSKGLSGKYIFKNFFWHDGTYVTTPEGIQSQEKMIGILSIESSALDMGNPGSAWRSCMRKQSINI